MIDTLFTQPDTTTDLSPVWPQAAATMRVDVAVTKDSEIWVLHDQPFPDALEWVEFDCETRILTFITAGGRLQDLGIPVHPPLDAQMARGKQVTVMYIRDGKIRDLGMVALAVRNAGRKTS